MAIDVETEVRRRLDMVADTTNLPDALLGHIIDVSEGLLAQWVPTYNRTGPVYDEATVQLAVKVYDVSARGTIAVDPAGEFVAPAPSATAGLVKSVWAYVAPLADDTTWGIA